MSGSDRRLGERDREPAVPAVVRACQQRSAGRGDQQIQQRPLLRDIQGGRHARDDAEHGLGELGTPELRRRLADEIHGEPPGAGNALGTRNR